MYRQTSCKKKKLTSLSKLVSAVHMSYYSTKTWHYRKDWNKVRKCWRCRNSDVFASVSYSLSSSCMEWSLEEAEREWSPRFQKRVTVNHGPLLCGLTTRWLFCQLREWRRREGEGEKRGREINHRTIYNSPASELADELEGAESIWNGSVAALQLSDNINY